MSALSRARAILERRAAGNPSEPPAPDQSRLAECYVETGIVHARMARVDESLAIHEKARAIQQGLIDRFPGDLRYRRALAENLNAIGYAYYKRLDSDAALRAFREVEDTCQSIMTQQARGRNPAWLLNLLALSQYNIGSIFKEKGDVPKALPVFEQALAHRVALAEQHPSVTQFQMKLGVSHREIADLWHQAHQDAKALQSIQNSVEIYANLVRSQPDQASFHGELGLSWNFVGLIHDEARRNPEAIPAFEHAVREQEIAIDKARDADAYQVALCYYLDNLGEQYVDLGRETEGLPHYHRALRISRELRAAHPESRDHAVELVKRLVALGSLHRHEGAPVVAQGLFLEARSIVDHFLVLSPGDATLRTWLCMLLDNEANTMTDQDQPERARPLLDRAVALFRPGPPHPPSAAELALEREARSEALWDLARVLRALELSKEASRMDAERIGVWTDCSPDDLVTLALKETNRAVLIGYGKTEVSDRAKAVRSLDLDQAAANVQLAIARGFKNAARIKACPDAAFLLARDDLSAAIAALESSERSPRSQPLNNPGKP
jgi:tetratricopeptide (TPR) repeat protein